MRENKQANREENLFNLNLEAAGKWENHYGKCRCKYCMNFRLTVCILCYKYVKLRQAQAVQRFLSRKCSRKTVKYI